MKNTQQDAQDFIESANYLIDATFGKSPLPATDHPGYDDLHHVWETSITRSKYPVWAWYDALDILIRHAKSTDYMPRLGDITETVNGLTEDERYSDREKLKQAMDSERLAARARQTERIRQRAEQDWLRKQEEKAEQEKV